MQDEKCFNYFIDSEGEIIEINSSVEEFSIKYSKSLHIDLKKIYYKIQQMNPKLKNLESSYKDLLINILGYVLCTINCEGIVDIVIPKYEVNSRLITKEQIDSIFDLIGINQKNMEKFKEKNKQYILTKNFDKLK